MLLYYIFISTVLELFLTFSVKCSKMGFETTVESNSGKIKGYSLFSRQFNPFYSFKGIPYAKVTKRFQPAELILKLDKELLDGNKFGAVCPQQDRTDFDENCLFLNVYVPKKGQKLKPVIVFVHGGSLSRGAGSFENPEYFMDEDVILVTINYRLGAFGFLTLGENEKIVPNLGLKDTVLALKWVQNNIEAFGGIKNKITLMAQSAGALVSSLLLFSPTAKGLFHRAILQSSAILDPWVYRVQSTNDDMGLRLLNALGCSNSTEIIANDIDCLLSKSAEEVIKAQGTLHIWYSNPIMAFAPIIEKEGAGAFIWEDPVVLLKEGRFNQVPIIITLTHDEGLLLQAIGVVKNENELKEYNDNWANVAPFPLLLPQEPDSNFKNLDPELQKNLTNQIRKFYFGDNELVYSPDIDDKTLDGFTKLFSDRYFNYGAQKTVEVLSKFVPVYTGIFTKPGNVSMIKVYGVTKNYGVSHGDDMQFFFPEFGYGPFPLLSKELTDISKSLVKSWVSFATYGVPYTEIKGRWITSSVKWGKATEVKSYFRNSYFHEEWVDLGKMPYEYSTLEKPFGNRLDFWDYYYKIVSN